MSEVPLAQLSRRLDDLGAEVRNLAAATEEAKSDGLRVTAVEDAVLRALDRIEELSQLLVKHGIT